MHKINIWDNYYFTNTITFKELRALATSIINKYNELGYLPTRIIIENNSISKYTYIITWSDSVSYDEISIRKIDMKWTTFFRVANSPKIWNDNLWNDNLWDEIINYMSEYEVIDNIIIPIKDKELMSNNLVNYILDINI